MYKASFEKRNKNILSILDNNSMTVYELARKLFTRLNQKRIILEIYLAVSEVYTHVQILENRGLIKLSLKNNKLFLSRTEEKY